MSMRSQLIIELTNTEVKIRDLETSLMTADFERAAAIREELHEQRTILRQQRERLDFIDRQWVIEQEEKVNRMSREAESLPPLEKEHMQDLIEDLKQRIQKRKNSLEDA